ncbi:dUTPase-like protein [Aspergillus crustosus]
MILSGRQTLTRQIVRSLLNASHQQQPCGIDLTLRQISQFTSRGTLDFTNKNRQSANTTSLPFDPTNHSITLPQGSYLIDFNETVDIPLDCMGSLFPRSSLWRSGVGIQAGVVDAGYQGAMGALLEVRNPFGVKLFRDAKVAQIVVEELGEVVEGYKGVYQGSSSSQGRNGEGEGGV